jgi:hypothetical protein
VSRPKGPVRLWRARRQHDRLEATLARNDDGWAVEFRLNDRGFVSLRFRGEARAREYAAVRLRELERAGWASHW